MAFDLASAIENHTKKFQPNLEQIWHMDTHVYIIYRQPEHIIHDNYLTKNQVQVFKHLIILSDESILKKALLNRL